MVLWFMLVLMGELGTAGRREGGFMPLVPPCPFLGRSFAFLMST